MYGATRHASSLGYLQVYYIFASLFLIFILLLLVVKTFIRMFGTDRTGMGHLRRPPGVELIPAVD
jgi:hypothetical protein